MRVTIYLETPVTLANAQAFEPFTLASCTPRLSCAEFSTCLVRLPDADARLSPTTSLATRPEFYCALFSTVSKGCCIADVLAVLELPVAEPVAPELLGVFAVVELVPALPEAFAAFEQLKLF